MMTSRIFFLFFALSFLLLVSCSILGKKQYSPKDDRYWESLVKESEETRSSILEIVKKRNPLLYSQVINDSKDPQLLTFWGQSRNFDGEAKAQIIRDQINSDLHVQFGQKSDNHIGENGCKSLV
jgi:hypothetical protein